MFDIGFWEMAFISVIALLIIGPERLPGVARTLGLWTGKARRMISDVKRDFKNELDQAELQNLKELKQDISSAASELKRTADDAAKEASDSGRDLKETLESVEAKSAGDSGTAQPSASSGGEASSEESEPAGKKASGKSGHSASSETPGKADTKAADEDAGGDLPNKAPA